MQIILDLDMDYFMTEVVNSIPDEVTDRLWEGYLMASVWKEKEVVRFFEHNLGLSKSRKIPGRVLTHHNESLSFWGQLIEEGILSTPFEVIHIDSHADMGLGTRGLDFITRKLLGFPVEDRPGIVSQISSIEGKRKDSIGDYLLYAIAYRWVGKLTYCANQYVKNSGNDYDLYALRDFKESLIFDKPVDNVIQLLFNEHMDIPCLNEYDEVRSYLEASKREPEVPFTIIPTIDDVSYSGNFDFAILAQSPNYTPITADFIMDVFRQYINEI